MLQVAHIGGEGYFLVIKKPWISFVWPILSIIICIMVFYAVLFSILRMFFPPKSTAFKNLCRYLYIVLNYLKVIICLKIVLTLCLGLWVSIQFILSTDITFDINRNHRLHFRFARACTSDQGVISLARFSPMHKIGESTYIYKYLFK